MLKPGRVRPTFGEGKFQSFPTRKTNRYYDTNGKKLDSAEGRAKINYDFVLEKVPTEEDKKNHVKDSLPALRQTDFVKKATDARKATSKFTERSLEREKVAYVDNRLQMNGRYRHIPTNRRLESKTSSRPNYKIEIEKRVKEQKNNVQVRQDTNKNKDMFMFRNMNMWYTNSADYVHEPVIPLRTTRIDMLKKKREEAKEKDKLRKETADAKKKRFLQWKKENM